MGVRSLFEILRSQYLRSWLVPCAFWSPSRPCAVVRPKHEVVVKSADYVPADLMNYTLLTSYRSQSLDYQEPGTFIGFLIFMGWMFLITHRSGQISA